ncbi:CbtA family protein [Halobellus rarus]|uniref:CbtA family protein n=1 Tax=Halobellus rarus TaxID=1126237 RepID=A0ABD6CIS9_9EURY|nr:CbtA family protein [Halobellus rarus]
MLTSHLKRGVKAGVVAGLAFGLLLALVANPLVAFADELGHEGGDIDGGIAESGTGEHHETDGGHHHGADGGHHGGAGDGPHESVVSSTVTNGVSVLSGVLWGILLGGVVFGFAFYLLEPAIPGTEGTKSYLLAAAGFVTVSGAPWLVLPPRPPGVSQSLPTETRTLLYGGMMAVGALACLLSGYAYQRLRERRGRGAAVLAAALPFGLLAVPTAFAPANSVESALPPDLATGLVGMTVFGQALLWVLLAGAHARLSHHSVEDRPSDVASDRSDVSVTAD